MSNMISSFVIVLKDDVHETYADRLQAAFKLFDGVIEVHPYVAETDVVAEITAITRERAAYREELIKLIKR